MNSWTSDFDKFVGHYSKYQLASDFGKESSDFVKFVDADIGRKVGFNRIAVHHIVLPPSCRTSVPHAESLEEEFVYVLKGNPHLWLNGFVYDLEEGHAVGFPAGTGVAHSVINNTESDIHLLVAGEKTKSENLCTFPINPEEREKCEIWWDNPPLQHLGTHSGLPGEISEEYKGKDSPSCIVFCPEIDREKPFHYAGDNESFGEGFRITDKVGLKALGIWYEILPPGKRSAFPHAHTHEEEFVYVLKGQPTIWLDGYAKQVRPEYFAAFPSNTGISHTIINDTDEEVVYLCIGETKEFPDEKIVYPLTRISHKKTPAIQSNL